MVTDVQLPLSNASRKGFANSTKEMARDPDTYEATVLRARQMLRGGPADIAGVEAAAASLLQFDTYARPSD